MAAETHRQVCRARTLDGRVGVENVLIGWHVYCRKSTGTGEITGPAGSELTVLLVISIGQGSQLI